MPDRPKHLDNDTLIAAGAGAKKYVNEESREIVATRKLTMERCVPRSAEPGPAAARINQAQNERAPYNCSRDAKTEHPDLPS